MESLAWRDEECLNDSSRDFPLRVVRTIVAGAVTLLVPTTVAATQSRVFLALAVLETAVLAIATAYAVYLGIYRYQR